jgi:glycosyltransferase involved in cell wall biosynthesis
MEKVRVCLVSQQFTEVLSGPGIYARNVVEGLVSRGHHVTLVAPQGAVRDCPEGVKVIVAGASNLAKKKGGWVILALEFARALRKLDKEGGIDLFHFTDAKEALFAVGLRRPVIGNINDPYIASKTFNPLFYKTHYPIDWVQRWLYLNLMFFLERYTLRRLYLNICNSKFTRKVIWERYEVSKERLALCYKSIQLESYPGDQEVQCGGTGQTVLFSGGGNAQRKGLVSFLKAATIVTENVPNIRYLVVGRDKTIPKIFEKHCSEKVAKRLQHIFHVPNEEMRQLYKKADLFVMPSLIEAFGVVYLEAMACGTAVIGTTEGGAKELIIHGENGLMIDPSDAEELAGSIIELLRDDNLRANLIKRGREDVKQYSSEKMIGEVLEIYKRTLSLAQLA